ncbi:esterase/lipase family protein [Geoalkalibacter sp.]|uniref:esterase/lipase family protein n=1 Tax=Geoalkalibacter sp. TaxID=3041440 RepID=UPI00272E17E0|nr:hypothetical protein [Geoalkalibacter sp.]
MSNPHAPFYPIIYVRGYAMTQSEQDETTADPFCGFNLGSTVYRSTPEKDRPAKKFIFESPLLRLCSDFGYADVYKDGLDIVDAEWEGPIPPRSIVIYRYYDEASKLLGTGKTPPITEFAKGLSRLILRVRELVCAHPESNLLPEDFRCYLVAHSMGGLVCRAFLQNPALGDEQARRAVDKVFTYATPHNGIDILGLNVPRFLSAADMNNFNRATMAKYLDLEALFKKTGRADWLPEEAFPSERFFCLVGTNRADYEAAMGLSRAFAGHGSDGLVRIDNASVWGTNARGQVSAPSATAYVYRAHSGFFGIVNSEEAYQNLTRFLFGDIRVDVWVDVDAVHLPTEIQGKPVNALYLFELLASPRGKRWYLTRRVAEEDSPACRNHQQLIDPADKNARKIFLSTVFLANRARVNAARPSLAYGLTLGVRVPEYEVERRFWADTHYEGGYLFRDTLVMEMVPPRQAGGDWTVHHGWQSNQAGRATQALAYKTLRNGKIEMRVAFGAHQAPGIQGHLRFVVSAWNS